MHNMSNTTDPELCSLTTNVCKPHKNFHFPGTAQHFMFVWFEEFPWVCYSCWKEIIYCLSCVLFGCKNKGKVLQKNISNMENNKNIQKTSKCFNRDTQKDQILFHRFLGEYTLFLTTCFLFWKIRYKGGPFFKMFIRTRGEGREKIRNL